MRKTREAQESGRRSQKSGRVKKYAHEYKDGREEKRWALGLRWKSALDPHRSAKHARGLWPRSGRGKKKRAEVHIKERTGGREFVKGRSRAKGRRSGAVVLEGHMAARKGTGNNTACKGQRMRWRICLEVSVEKNQRTVD